MKISDAKQFGRVAVLMGGTAAERDISLLSGNAVLKALQAQHINAIAVDVGEDIAQVLSSECFDRAFNVLHGRGGEDGVIQGLLESLKLPYTGSGVLGSAITMDKYRTKLLWQGLGLPTPGFALINTAADLDAAAELGFPLMIKPVHEGSSIGMAYVEDRAALQQAWQDAARFDHQVMAEKWIEGAEYTVSMLAEQVLPMIRLETENRFYDYQAKYESDKTRYHVPCGLDQNSEAHYAKLARTAFDASGCNGWGRVDMLVDSDDNPWLIEINSVPGMTSHSLVPMAAAAVGISFEQLVWQILEQTVN